MADAGVYLTTRVQGGRQGPGVEGFGKNKQGGRWFLFVVMYFLGGAVFTVVGFWRRFKVFVTFQNIFLAVTVG